LRLFIVLGGGEDVGNDTKAGGCDLVDDDAGRRDSTRSFGSHTAVSDSLCTPFKYISSNVRSPTLSAIFWWYSTCGVTKR